MSDKRGRKPKSTAIIARFSKSLTLGFDGMCYHLTSTLKDSDHFRATTNNEHKTTFYYRTFLQVINDIVVENNPQFDEYKKKAHLILNDTNLKKVKEIKSLLLSKRKATLEDLPRIMKVVDVKGYWDIDFIHPISKEKIKNEGLYMSDKGLEKYIFEANIKMKRFENLNEIVSYLKTTWN